MGVFCFNLASQQFTPLSGICGKQDWFKIVGFSAPRINKKKEKKMKTQT